MIIDLLLIAITIANTIIGSLTYWAVHTASDTYIPFVLFFGTYIGGLLLVIIYYMIVSWFILIKKTDGISKFSALHLKDAIRYICNRARVKVNFKGEEKLPIGEKYLFVCNHLSNFDPMITYAYFPENISFITKPSNMHIFVGGRFLKKLHFLPIDKDNKLQSLQVMKEASDLISNNITSVGVYPEGMRRKYGDMGEFHAGVFSIALKAKCPLVISSINEVQKIKTNFPWKRTVVNLDIIQVKQFEEIEGRNVNELSDEVKNLIKLNLESYETNVCKTAIN